MKKTNAKLKKIYRLMHSLDEELLVLESLHRIQFETTASLKDKLYAAKRARTALTKARELSNLITETLLEPNE